MSALLIKMTKRSDGTVVSRFERADGTVTWQRKDARHGDFFALHDLEHYAVETTLGYCRGFYGLVAEGWDLADFGTPWPRGPIPADAEPAELIVGFLDGERAGGAEWTAQDFNKNAALYFAQRGYTNPPTLDDAMLARVRAAAKELMQRWSALPVGETLELAFEARAAAR